VRAVSLLMIAGSFFFFVAFRVQGALVASRKAKCFAHLHQIGVALHSYEAEHGHFPAPAIASEGGAPLLSWRVAILPQLGYRALYDRFRLDEPWDSAHNLALLREIPREFVCPAGAGRSAGATGYLVIVGPKTDPTSVNTPFQPGRGVDIRSITDGTSNTILVMETKRAVPWTKPEDLAWQPGARLPQLASRHGAGTHVLLADAAVRFIKATLAPETLLAILTINGGEVTGA
jgi:hypothetical protein